ncbi:ACT domain-containing protein [Pendulispora albinea]|uniref:ACT domain-containing protein n=1 Tax=Pendulispora albinea TaxID=2741071 RepID=A0ABZ2LQ75_9BACT
MSGEPRKSGERDLAVLLRAMQPVVNPGEYVFATIAGAVPEGLDPIVTVREPEGRTLVIPRADADAAGLPYAYVAGWITLRVHSALDAVGLTAAVATALAREGMSCNVVAGYYHDHLFVARADTERAMGALQRLTTAQREE